MYITVILLVILIALSAFFSMSEAALLSVSRLRVRHFIEQKRHGSRELKKLKDNPQRLLVTILVGNNLVNIAASAIGTAMAINIFKDNAIGISIGVMTFLLLVFGEILPKSIAIRFNTHISLAVSKPIWYFSVILTPLVKFFGWLTDFILWIFGLTRSYAPKVTEEDIKSIVRMGQEEGAIDSLEKELIERVFRFDDIDVLQIMKPKSEIKVVSSEMKLKAFLDVVVEYQHSRYPIYEKARDNITGIVHVKDVLESIKTGNLDVPVKDVAMKPMFVYSGKKIDDLLRQFQKLKEQMAIVINEKGNVIGIVTMEDILEEIVGEIVDENERVKPRILKVDDKTWRVYSGTDIDVINKELSLGIKSSSDYETLLGLALTKLGRNPKPNEEIDFGNFVLKADVLDKNNSVKEFVLVKK